MTQQTVGVLTVRSGRVWTTTNQQAQDCCSQQVCTELQCAEYKNCQLTRGGTG